MAEPNTDALRKHSVWPPVPPHEALRHCRRYLVGLLTSRLPEAVAAPSAPDAPEVDVMGVVCHLTTTSRLAETNLTGRQPALAVAARGRPSLTEVLAEWERSSTVVEEALSRARGMTGSLLATDVFTHELDLRQSLGAGDPAYHPALGTALDVAANGAAAMVGMLGLPALRLETTGAVWEIGEGEPAATLWAPPLELYRCLAGRRSPARIRVLSWSDDPEPWLRVFERGPLRACDVPAGRDCGRGRRRAWTEALNVLKRAPTRGGADLGRIRV